MGLDTSEERSSRAIPVTWRAFYLINFLAKKVSEEINDLLWVDDGAWDAGEIFSKSVHSSEN